MENIVENKTTSKKKPPPATEVKPFDLTQPRPRSIPIPEPIPTMKKTRPVPKTTYAKPNESNILEGKRVVNRREAEKHLVEANKLQPICATNALEKSEKVTRRLEEIVQQRENELDFECIRANPVPDFRRDAPPVKLNAAAIMREWKLYRDKEEKELKKLEAIESGAFDATNFLRWQDSVREVDLAVELAEVERRRLGGKLSYEEAILARRRLEEENKAAVARMKVAAERQAVEVAKQRITEKQAMKELVEEVLACKENARQSKLAVKEQKKKIAKEMMEEIHELHEQAKAKAVLEMERKLKVIAQIRDLEASAAARRGQEKLVDMASTQGYGFLCEMSLVELNERLRRLHSDVEREREEKRDTILEQKQQMSQKLLDSLEQISKHRAEKTRVAAIKLEDKKLARGYKKPPVEVKDPQLDEMQNRLNERRAERVAQQKKFKAVTQPTTETKQMVRQLSKEKKACEEARWAELEVSEERKARLLSQGSLQSDSARVLAQRLAVL